MQSKLVKSRQTFTTLPGTEKVLCSVLITRPLQLSYRPHSPLPAPHSYLPHWDLLGWGPLGESLGRGLGCWGRWKGEAVWGAAGVLRVAPESGAPWGRLREQRTQVWGRSGPAQG